MKVTTLGTALVAASLSALIGGCKGSGGDARDSAAAPAAAAAPSTATADTAKAGGDLTDANIVYLLDRANLADSARGRLAQTKATSADVKSFGQLMMGEHHALR